MEPILIAKLRAYIAYSHPDLLLQLLEENKLATYLEEKVKEVMPVAERWLNEAKPLYIVEELCLDAMTAELKPSRYLYIRDILMEEFEQDYERLRKNGMLPYEISNMIEACKDIFEEFDFNTENEDNRFLKYAVIGQVHDYLA